jgi:hypothetical protein
MACSLLLLILSSAAWGKGDSEPPPEPPKRYLVIVETSSAMQPRAKGVFDTVKALLDSNLKGQLRPGDTLGIWTFNDVLNLAWFPLQEWSPEMKLPLAVRMASFSQPQAYERGGSLEKVLAEMNQAVRAYPDITIILVTSGSGEMRGTPFDKEINSGLKQWLDPQEKAKMPLVTVLHGMGGQVAAWSVNSAPLPANMPLSLAPVEVAQTKPAGWNNEASGLRFSTTPLVVSAKQSQPAPTPATTRPAVQTAAPASTPATPAQAAPATTTLGASPQKEVAATKPTLPAAAPAAKLGPVAQLATASAIAAKAEPAPATPKSAPPQEVSATKSTPPAAPPTQKLVAAAAATQPIGQKAAAAPAPELPKNSPPASASNQAASPPAPTPVAKSIAAVVSTEVKTLPPQPPQIVEKSRVAEPGQPSTLASQPVPAANPTHELADVKSAVAPQTGTPLADNQRKQPAPASTPLPAAPIIDPNENPTVARARELPEPGAGQTQPVRRETPAIPTAVASATPHGSFLGQNALWIGILLLAGAGTAYCLLMWVRSFSRAHVDLVTLPQAKQEMQSPLTSLPPRTDLPSAREMEHAGGVEPQASAEAPIEQKSEENEHSVA